MSIVTNEQITPREQWISERDKEIMLLQFEHQKAMKSMQLESEKLSSKWTVVFRLPLALIKLPISLVVCLALVVYAIRGIEPPESLVSFIKV